MDIYINEINITFYKKYYMSILIFYFVLKIQIVRPLPAVLQMETTKNYLSVFPTIPKHFFYQKLKILKKLKRNLLCINDFKKYKQNLTDL